MNITHSVNMAEKCENVLNVDILNTLKRFKCFKCDLKSGKASSFILSQLFLLFRVFCGPIQNLALFYVCEKTLVNFAV